jgi:hypothetical protein
MIHFGWVIILLLSCPSSLSCISSTLPSFTNKEEMRERKRKVGKVTEK